MILSLQQQIENVFLLNGKKDTILNRSQKAKINIEIKSLQLIVVSFLSTFDYGKIFIC
tara:strand:- start:4298 stop:4471 length:174 start_codon:yes stop_codon:yes gene_type:complete